MADSAFDSDRILAEARSTLARQRLGSARQSVGSRAAQIKRRHWRGKLARILLAIAVIQVAAIATGMVIGGIGLNGVMLMALAIIVAVGVLARWPRLAPPSRASLSVVQKDGDPAKLVGATQLWLEAARPALPAPAVRLVDQIGGQLDGLERQLAGVDASQPAIADVRQLVGEQLPGMIEDYQRIPAPLRHEQRGGRSADQQLADGLTKISREIDAITRQLAAGDLDALAVRARYLDYRYGDALDSDTPRLGQP